MKINPGTRQQFMVHPHISPSSPPPGGEGTFYMDLSRYTMTKYTAKDLPAFQFIREGNKWINMEECLVQGIVCAFVARELHQITRRDPFRVIRKD